VRRAIAAFVFFLGLWGLVLPAAKYKSGDDSPHSKFEKEKAAMTRRTPNFCTTCPNFRRSTE